MTFKAPGDDDAWMRSSPAYQVLDRAGALCTEYRVRDVASVFTENDYIANSSRDNDMAERLKWGFYCGGCLCYYAAHSEVFVPAGHVGLLMDSHNHYLFAQPGMHNISSCFTRVEGRPLSLRALIEHGDRTVVTVEQGYIGYCTDNGTPVLLPQGVHTWRSDSLSFERSVPLSDHVIELGPYTILTVDEGYAAVTQNNGKQMVLPGGHSHFLSHKNWKFEKFISTKIQTNDLDQILCTSADNIESNCCSFLLSVSRLMLTHPSLILVDNPTRPILLRRCLQ